MTSAGRSARERRVCTATGVALSSGESVPRWGAATPDMRDRDALRRRDDDELNDGNGERRRQHGSSGWRDKRAGAGELLAERAVLIGVLGRRPVTALGRRAVEYVDGGRDAIARDLVDM